MSYDSIMILIVYTKNCALVTLGMGPNTDADPSLNSTKTNSYVCQP